MEYATTMAHREMYWHIGSPYKFLIYPILAVALAFFIYGAWKRIKFLKEGRPDTAHWGDWWARIKLFLWEAPLQAKVLEKKEGGLIHVAIFWSFIALMFTTAVVFMDVDFGVPIYNGAFYLALTLAADLAGLMLFAGLVYAAARRYVLKPDMDSKWDDALVLALLGFLVITGFLLEGMRIHYTGDPWAKWSPIGYLVSLGMGNLSEATAVRIYQATWWTHAIAAFTFIAAMPYTKLFHIFTLPANIFFSSLEPKGSLPRVDVEALMNDEAALENFNIGVSTVKDLTWKNRLDLDACVRCGRCEDVCPANLNGKSLSPKKFVTAMKDFAHKNANNTAAGSNGNGNGEAAAEPPLIAGNAFNKDILWECRTCRACMEVCPAHVEHIPQIMELRRADVMMRGELPFEASVALKTLANGGNPFGPQEERIEWIAENQIPVIGPGEECEALFWVGCCTTYDCAKHKVAFHVLQILMGAGVNVGVMGMDETCCGDPARVLGDENLFQSIVKANIEKIKSRKFKYLITHCPHCYNVFKNEYPQFGADFKVLHHTEVIYNLIKENRVKLELPIEKKITYHDACYLGRYNEIYNIPREILKSIKGVELVEMENNRECSRCCGGGGGHYWMDIPTGERLNVTRIKEAQKTNADIVAVGCVFCLQMMNDAIKILNADETLDSVDISELVVKSMGGQIEIKALAAAREKEAA